MSLNLVIYFFLSTEVDFLRNNRSQEDRLMIVLGS